jgi:hypothetical protein
MKEGRQPLLNTLLKCYQGELAFRRGFAPQNSLVYYPRVRRVKERRSLSYIKFPLSDIGRWSLLHEGDKGGEVDKQ